MTAVRPATGDDLPAVNEIYNHYVRDTHVTFDLEPMTAEARREWLSHHARTGRHRALVAYEGTAIIGFATSGPFRAKPAYLTSVETSVYVAPHAVGRGAGTALYSALFTALEGEDLHRAYAGIAQPNAASTALHERFGFVRAGSFTEQGRKFGRYWDVVWFERPL